MTEPPRYRREDAIDLLVDRDLKSLGHEDKYDRLYELAVSDWDAETEQLLAPIAERVREIAQLDEEVVDVDAGQWIPALRRSLFWDYSTGTDKYLQTELRDAGYLGCVVGESGLQLEACPCCGLKSISDRGAYEICQVCWWEDDGQDNQDADKFRGGPNHHQSLTTARANFLRCGLYDPDRMDLTPHAESKEKYEIGRVFALANHGREVIEIANGEEIQRWTLPTDNQP